MALWNSDTGEVIQELVVLPQIEVFRRQTLSESHISAMALSRDRRWLALSRTGGKTVEIWETASGSKRGELSGHAGPIASVAFSHDGKHLVSGCEDTTILVWDMARPLQPLQPSKRLAQAELDTHWKALLEPDAKKAEVAVWSLVNTAPDSVPFLKKQLPPAARPDPERVKGLLASLDSDEYELRAKAQAELERHGEFVLAELEAALKGKNSLDKQRLLEKSFAAAKVAARPFGTPEKMRQSRALEVLERIGSPEARQVLRDLAAGASGARLTVAARSALARLETSAKAED